MGLGDLAEEVEGEKEEDEELQDVIDLESSSEASAPPGRENVLLQPVSDVKDVVKLYDTFDDIKSELIKSSDKTQIGDNWHINKSGWRKIATAFNLTVETLHEEIWVEDGIVYARVKAKATAPNGKSSTGLGMCSSNESNFMMAGKPDVDDPEESRVWYEVDGKWRKLQDPRAVNHHNLYATAETRAKNRAISDCVGGGEVSAEEIGPEDVLG